MKKDRADAMYTEEQLRRAEEFLKLTDEEFYERYVRDAPVEERLAFLHEFPEFSRMESPLDYAVK